MALLSQFRCSIEGPTPLGDLVAAPLPLGLKASPTERSLHRDVYLDTADKALAARGVSCRLRIQADDRRFLTLILAGGADRPPERWEAPVAELDARRALEGTTEPARRLQGMVDPALLKPRIEIETERWTRSVPGGWFQRGPRFTFLYDCCTVRHSGLVRQFEELQVRRLGPGGPHLDQIAAALERQHGLRPILISKAERATRLVDAMAGEATARLVASQRAVSLLVFDEGQVAFIEEDGAGLILPVARGSGEEACRHLLRHLFGSGVGELSLLGHAMGSDDRPSLEVWMARKVRVDATDRGDDRPTITWMTLARALGEAGTVLRSSETLGALALAARLDLATDPGAPLPERPSRPATGSPVVARRVSTAARATTDAPPEHFLNVELSQLAFHERVLEMAEDPALPLAERLRFLAIVSSNLDEFFSVRVGALKQAIADGDPKRSFDGLSPAEQFDAIAARVPGLIERQQRAAAICLAELGPRGVRVRRWTELDREAREGLVRYFAAELLPVLTPRAVTLSPGHPFPIIPDQTLAFAVLVRDVHTGPVHFAYLAIPPRLRRFVPIPGGADLMPLEELVRSQLQAFYPDRPVEQAWLFRLTRGAELDVAEEDAGDLLQAIEEEVRRRPLNAAVRIELERGTPAVVRDLLQRELRFERRGGGLPLGSADSYEIDGWLDLTCLRDLAGRLPAADNFPPFTPRNPFAGAESVFSLIESGDQLVHHPGDDFVATVGRFFTEAAADPDVVAIKATLYRVGERSPVVDALVNAARAGKEVAAFVELKARFDETHNVQWVKRLEEAGAHVVYGIVGIKTHAKVALVVRQTPGGVRRYAHIGTGNYNASTARYYTDLGLFTADPEITADLVDLFNQLTGSTAAPTGETRKLLISPVGTLPGLLARIEREVGHVAEGRGGLIRIQLNGLEDPEVISALYRAATAGVAVHLVVRGLCSLRPGVPGLSERVRVRSVLGRFLEHQRIFHFGNGGADDYLIGSADLRPRNLRRRVEVLVPVSRPDLKVRLVALLDQIWSEPAGWELGADGRYVRPAPVSGTTHLHDRLVTGT